MSMNRRAVGSMLLMLIIACLYSYRNCQAQPIVGHWHLTELKGTATNKADGRTQDISDQMKQVAEMFVYEFTFNADHTMLQTGGIKGQPTKTYKGTYTFEGDKLSMNTELTRKVKQMLKNYKGSELTEVPPDVSITFSGGHMIWHTSTDVSMDDNSSAHVEGQWVYSKF